MIKKRNSHLSTNTFYDFNKFNEYTYFAEETIRDKEYNIGDEVFILFSSYSTPNFFLTFISEIKSKVSSDIDGSINYEVILKHSNYSRETLKDFFYNEYFIINEDIKNNVGELNSGRLTCFSFNDEDLLETLCKDENRKQVLQYSNMQAFFRNNERFFTFIVNENYIFDTLSECKYMEYTMNFENSVESLRNIFRATKSIKNIKPSDPIAINSTMEFMKLHKKFIIQIILSMPVEFHKYLETDFLMAKFCNEILLKRGRIEASFEIYMSKLKRKKTTLAGKFAKATYDKNKYTDNPPTSEP